MEVDHGFEVARARATMFIDADMIRAPEDCGSRLDKI